MDTASFDNVQQLLRYIKGLSKDEAKILIKIIERGTVTAADVGEILSELKLANTKHKHRLVGNTNLC